MTVAFRAAARLIVFDGQSLNNNPYGASTSAWPYKCMNGYGTPYAEVWIGGTPWSALADSRYQRVDPKANSATLTGLSMMGDTTGVALGQAGATLYGIQRTYALAAITAGYEKVVNFTTPPSTEFTAPQEDERVILNDLILGNAEGTWDGVVDLTLDSRLNDPADTAYFLDGTHLHPTAHTLVADLARPVFVTAGLIAA